MMLLRLAILVSRISPTGPFELFFSPTTPMFLDHLDPSHPFFFETGDIPDHLLY